MIHAPSNTAALPLQKERDFDPHPPCSNPVITDRALCFLLGFVCSHLGSLCQSRTYLHNCFRRNTVFTWEASGHIGDGWKSCASSGGQGSCGVNGRWSHLAQVGWVRLVVGPRRGWLCLPGVWKIREIKKWGREILGHQQSNWKKRDYWTLTQCYKEWERNEAQPAPLDSTTLRFAQCFSLPIRYFGGNEWSSEQNLRKI